MGSDKRILRLMRGHAGAVGLLVVCVDRGNGTDRLDSGGAWSSFEAGLCAKGSHGVSPWVVVTFKKRKFGRRWARVSSVWEQGYCGFRLGNRFGRR